MATALRAFTQQTFMLKSQYHWLEWRSTHAHTHTVYKYIHMAANPREAHSRVCVAVRTLCGGIFACDIAIYAQIPIITCK